MRYNLNTKALRQFKVDPNLQIDASIWDKSNIFLDLKFDLNGPSIYLSVLDI